MVKRMVMFDEKTYKQKLIEQKEELKTRLRNIDKLLKSMDGEDHGMFETELLTHEHFDLQSRDHIYRMLFENLSEGALVINNQRIIVYANKYFAGLIGSLLQKVIGSDFNSYLDQRDLDGFSDCLEKALKQRSFCLLTLKSRKSGDVTVMVSFNGFMMDDQRYYSMIITDVSFQKRIEKGLENKIAERTEGAHGGHQ